MNEQLRYLEIRNLVDASEAASSDPVDGQLRVELPCHPSGIQEAGLHDQTGYRSRPGAIDRNRSAQRVAQQDDLFGRLTERTDQVVVGSSRVSQHTILVG